MAAFEAAVGAGVLAIAPKPAMKAVLTDLPLDAFNAGAAAFAQPEDAHKVDVEQICTRDPR